jgi:uncharacterized protein YoxC
MKQLVAANEKIIKTQQSGANKLYDQSIRALQERLKRDTGMSTKITGDLLGKILSTDINGGQTQRNRYKAQYEQYQKDKEALDKKYNKRFKSGGVGQFGVSYGKEALALQKKYGEAIYANQLLFKYSDKELEEINNQYKEGLNYQQLAISNESKLLRYTKERNAAGGGRGGSREESTAEKVKRQWEDAKNNAYLFARELQDVQKNTLPSIEERFNNISAFDKLNAQRYQSLVKQGKGRFSFNDNGGEKTYNEEGIEVYFTVNEESVQDIYTKYDNMVNRIQEAMRDNELGILSAEEVNATIDYINKELEKLGLKPIVLHVKTDAEKTLDATAKAIGDIGSSISGLGQALEAPALDVAGVMAQAIATLIQGYAFATSDAGKKLGAIGWLGFGAIGLAQLVAIISTVKSLGAYANGGIVGGSSYAGDRLYARVNSGEMILNSQQQSHLFNMINNGGGGAATNGSVQFVIRGADLYGAMKNYNSKMKKVR